MPIENSDMQYNIYCSALEATHYYYVIRFTHYLYYSYNNYIRFLVPISFL